MTHHSTAIEGSTLSESEVIDLLYQGKTTESKPFEHHLMAVDYFAAIKYVLERTKERPQLTLDFIQKVNGLVMKNTGGMVNTVLRSFDISAGDFRKSTYEPETAAFPIIQKLSHY